MKYKYKCTFEDKNGTCNKPAKAYRLIFGHMILCDIHAKRWKGTIEPI